MQCATHLPEETPYYKAMIRCFCLSAKAMHLRRDVCLWHVAEYICHHEAHYIVILYEVLCHCEALPNRGPCGILCTRGEKAYTSKRVSVIACDNVISKTRFATRTRPRKNLPRNVTGSPQDTVYLWGLKTSNSRRFKELGGVCRFKVCCTEENKRSARCGQVMDKYRIMTKTDYKRLNYLCKIHNKINRINIVRY